MKSLGQILEALPVPGFKPPQAPKPKGPAKPAEPSRTSAQVITPKGRFTTVKKPAAMRKPGYSFAKYNPPKNRMARLNRPDFHPKLARKPIKSIAYGRTPIKEMKIIKFEIKEKREDDAYTLDGYAEVSFDNSDVQQHGHKLDDQARELVADEIQSDFGKEAAQGVSMNVKKIGNKFRVEVYASDSYENESQEIKGLIQLIDEG